MNQDLSDCETRTNQEAKNLCYKNKEEQENLARKYQEQYTDNSQMNGRDTLGRGTTNRSLGATSVQPTQYITEDNASFGVEQIVLIVVAVSIVISAAMFIYLKKFKS